MKNKPESTVSSTAKSPWLVHYNGSSCNGCDIEVLATLTPRFDVERFGVINTGNPKHADVLLVTGGVNNQGISVLQQIYSQMLEPKVVIACGVCACNGGIFKECYNTVGGVDSVIPVDVYAPGCAIRPEAIIDALLQGIQILDRRRVELLSGDTVGVGTIKGELNQDISERDLSGRRKLQDPLLPTNVQAKEDLQKEPVSRQTVANKAKAAASKKKAAASKAETDTGAQKSKPDSGEQASKED